MVPRLGRSASCSSSSESRSRASSCFLPPLGAALFVAYGYILVGMLRGENLADGDQLRDRLIRRRRPPR
jgi:hypothetical protein